MTAINPPIFFNKIFQAAPCSKYDKVAFERLINSPRLPILARSFVYLVAISTIIPVVQWTVEKEIKKIKKGY